MMRRTLNTWLIIGLIGLGYASAFGQTTAPSWETPPPGDEPALSHDASLSLPSAGEDALPSPPPQSGQNGLRRQKPLAQPQQDVLYLTPEQEREAIAYIREVYPDRLENLLAIKERRPLLYRRFLSRGYREMRHLEEMKEKDPERYDQRMEEKRLDEDARNLARQYRESDDESEKARLKDELKVLLDRIFDYRQRNRQFEIEKLERRLAELKETNQQRLDNKDEIVQRRLDQMLGRQREWEW
jgi:hypothetical protein